MGRTIPSFRIATSGEQNEWKEVRKQLDKSDRKIFERMPSIETYVQFSMFLCC